MRHGFGGNASHFGHNRFDFGLADGFALLRFGQGFLGGGGFVDHINGFVGQKALIDVARRQFRCGLQGGVGVAHLVKAFKHRF